MSITYCHQKKIRDYYQSHSPVNKNIILHNTEIKPISRIQAEEIILKYEWLKTMGRPVISFGLFYENELIGAVNFGRPPGPLSADICGKALRGKAICLERGACAHWTPKNTPSYFITNAVKLANKLFGWEIFFAYADESAGEIGVIYQACNWHYIGKGIGRPIGRKREYFEDLDGNIISERTLTENGLRKNFVLNNGWKIHYREAKHKYVWFEGTKVRKKFLKQMCQYEYRQYPKRSNVLIDSILLEEC